MKTEKTIRNCSVKVKYNCPKNWEDLEPTENESVKHCSSCDKDVYYCRSDTETLEHAKIGNCIARELPSTDELPIMFLGRVEAQPEETADQTKALEWTRREVAIDEALNRKNPSKHCFGCGFATSEWSKKCKICGVEFKDAKVYKA